MVSNMNKKRTGTNEEIAKLAAENKQLRQQLEEAKSKNYGKRALLGDLKERIEMKERKLGDLKGKYKEKVRIIEEQHRESLKLDSRVQSLTTRLKDEEQTVRGMEHHNKQLKDELERVQERLANPENRIE
jgi:chromosome segregation ATPase